jgi:adenylate cyclase
MSGTQKNFHNLANLSHDLRTPLNAIIGFSEMLDEVCNEQGWVHISADLRRINQAGRTLLDIIKEAFEPERIDVLMAGGEDEIIDPRVDFRIRTALNSIIGYTEMVLEEAGEEDLHEIVPELEKIHTAANLFMKQISNASATWLETATNKPNRITGTVSQIDQGLSTPVSQIQGECAGPGRVQRGNILVVEDDPMDRDLLTYHLRRLGHSVESAENGQQALEMLRIRRFELVLLDIILPVVDGFEVLTQIKSNMAQRDIPVIIITSLDDQEHTVKGIRMGADDCLSKPFDAIILGARVEACLQRKRWHDQEQEYLTIIKAEREKSEHLLLQMLPAPVAERLKQGQAIIADGYQDVTVLFADMVNFTPLTTQMKPKALVILMNDLFCMFDDLVRQHDLEKIRAIGDEFVVAAGLVKPRPDHTEAVADFALDMLNELEAYNASHARSLAMRIGIETGPVIAGVIGTTQFSYDLWGDAINTASRMQSHGLSGRIHLTEKTYLRLKDKYVCEKRGVTLIKGKGKMRTYFLNSKRR